jgi:UrcA family protein
MTGSGIIVTAPRRVGRSAIGAPIELVSSSRAVNIRDIDIMSARGQLELNRRITTAARDACRDLQTRYPIGTPDARTCERNAVDSARAEVDAMRALAMQTATPPAAGAAAAPSSATEAAPPQP